MKGIKADFLIRMTVSMVFCLLLGVCSSNELRAEDSCVTCHTDEEKLLKSLGKEDKAKSSLQAGPG